MEKPTRLVLAAVALALPWLLPAAPAQGAWFYFDEQEALEIAFPEAEAVRLDLEARMDPKRRLEIEKKLGYATVLPELKVFQGVRDGEVVGYAFIDNVIGRSRPITFMVRIDHPEGVIAHYEIMIYREMLGHSVRKGPFRKQFYGKSIEDPLRYGEDLRLLTGATMSAEGLLKGFRKHLYLYEYYLKDLPALTGGDS